MQKTQDIEKRLKELDDKMAALRKELEGLVLTEKSGESFEKYYQKNLELDRLLEEYLDLKESTTSLHQEE